MDGIGARSAWFLLSLGCIANTSIAHASADAVTYSLGWTRAPGAETCAGGGALARAVEARLGHAAWVPASSADVLIEGYIEKRTEPPGWHAHVEVTDSKGGTLGQRDVVSEELRCEALEKPLALMLALIVDPRLLLSTDPGSSPASPPVDVASARPVNGVGTEATPAAPPTSARRGEIQLGGAVSMGLLPGIAAGLTLNETLSFGTWAVELGGTLWAPRRVDTDEGRGASFSLLVLAARACPLQHTDATWLFRTCAGAEGGMLVAQGYGFNLPDHAQRPALFASASAEGAVRAGGPVWLGLRLGSLLPLVRERFTYRSRLGPDRELFRMSAVAGTAELSLGLRF